MTTMLVFLCAIPVFHLNDFKIGEMYGRHTKT